MGGPLLNDLLRKGLLKQRLVTGPTSEGYPQWQSNNYTGASPEYFYVYLFHCNNSEAVMQGKEKPYLTEIGPFVYTHDHHFFDIKFSEDNKTVDCKRSETYHWIESMSIGNPYTTQVTVANIPYAGVRSKVEPDQTWWSGMGLDLLTSLAGADVFVNTTVHAYVFGGDAPMLEWLNKTIPQLHQKTWFELQHNFTSDDEGREFLKNKTDTYYTGVDDPDMMGVYKVWHGLDNLAIWNSTDANILTGTDGTRFGIELANGTNVSIFIDTTYRHAHFWYNMTKEVQGIEMRRYWLDPFMGVNESDGNYAYYLNAPYGLNNMSAPYVVEQGAPVPIFLSLPYFFHCDPFYVNQFDFGPQYHGQNESYYNTELNIEPYTGLTMAAQKRIQVNVLINRTMLLYPNMSGYYFPVAWFELTSEISDELAHQFKSQVYLVAHIIDHMHAICGSISAATLLLAFILLALGVKACAETDPSEQGYSVVSGGIN